LKEHFFLRQWKPEMKIRRNAVKNKRIFVEKIQKFYEEIEKNDKDKVEQ